MLQKTVNMIIVTMCELTGELRIIKNILGDDDDGAQDHIIYHLDGTVEKARIYNRQLTDDDKKNLKELKEVENDIDKCIDMDIDGENTEENNEEFEDDMEWEEADQRERDRMNFTSLEDRVYVIMEHHYCQYERDHPYFNIDPEHIYWPHVPDEDRLKFRRFMKYMLENNLWPNNYWFSNYKELEDYRLKVINNILNNERYLDPYYE